MRSWNLWKSASSKGVAPTYLPTSKTAPVIRTDHVPFAKVLNRFGIDHYMRASHCRKFEGPAEDVLTIILGTFQFSPPAVYISRALHGMVA